MKSVVSPMPGLAARSRLFDVVLGIGLAAVLMLLSPYVNLPRIL